MKSYEFTVFNILQKYQFSREDAEAFLETIKEAKSDETATKTDILKLEAKITQIEKDIRMFDVRVESVKN
jgi:hypothetical protein